MKLPSFLKEEMNDSGEGKEHEEEADDDTENKKVERKKNAKNQPKTNIPTTVWWTSSKGEEKVTITCQTRTEANAALDVPREDDILLYNDVSPPSIVEEKG